MTDALVVFYGMLFGAALTAVVVLSVRAWRWMAEMCHWHEPIPEGLDQWGEFVWILRPDRRTLKVSPPPPRKKG